MRKALWQFWPLLIATAVIFAFFIKLFLPDQSIFITPDYGRSDSWHLSIANKFYYAGELKKNRLPIWNPHIGSGFPTLAEGQTGIFFAPNLILFRFLPFVTAYNLSIVFTLILAASGTYLFCRSQNINKLAATYGGLIFALGGFFVVHVQHLHLIQTASILPWLFWATNEFLKSRKILFLIYSSLLLSQQIFAGFPQITFYSLTMLIIFAIYKIALQKNHRLKLTIFFVISIILGLALSAIQLLPTYELLSVSTRESNPKFVLDQFPYKFKNLLQFVDPFVLGSPKDGTYPRWTPGQWGIFWESVAYVGILPLILTVALIIANLFKKTKISKLVLFLAFLCLLSLLLSLEGSSPLHPLFSFPPFSIFRVPSRFLLISQLSLSVLAALFLQKIAKKTIIVLILIVSQIDLFWHFATYNATDNSKKWFETPLTAQTLKKENAKRILTVGQSRPWNEIFLANGWAESTEYYRLARNALDQNSNLIFNIDQFSAFESLQSKRTATLNNSVTQGIKIENEKVAFSKNSQNLLAASNVSHVITPYEIENEGFTKIIETEIADGTSFKVFSNSQKPLRFFMSAKYDVAETITEIVKKITSENFDPTDSIVLEKPPPIKELLLGNWQARITAENDSMVQIEVETEADGFFVLSDSFYPGWKAYVDGNESPVLAANINQRAILIKNGKHQILFKYQPDSLRVGSLISIISLSQIILILTKFKNSKIT